jgi:hypothetical protein
MRLEGLDKLEKKIDDLFWILTLDFSAINIAPQPSPLPHVHIKQSGEANC